MKFININVPVSQKTHKAIKTAAAQRGTSVKAEVQIALDRAFKFQQPEAQDTPPARPRHD